MISDAVAFSSPAEGLVQVPAPKCPTYIFAAYEFATGETANFLRINVIPDNGGVIHQLTTGSNGQVSASIPSGIYSVSIDSPDFGPATESITLELPPIAEDGQPVTQVACQLAAAKPLSFNVELRGGRMLGPTDEFSLCIPPSKSRIPFNSQYNAPATIDFPEHPIAIKVWLPGGFSSFYYLDGGMPSEGDTVVLELMAGAPLEVAVKLADDAAILADREDCVLAVHFHDKHGNAVAYGRSVSSSGAVRFPSVPTGPASVSLSINRSIGTVETLSVANCIIREDTVNHCTLSASSLPIKMRFTGEGSRPMAGAHVELYSASFDTPWACGGATDSDGRFSVPSTDEKTISCRLIDFSGPQPAVVLDAVIDTSLLTQDAKFDAMPFAPLEVELTTTDGSTPQATVELLGKDHPVVFHRVFNDADGNFEPTLISTASKASVRLSVAGYWVPSPTREFTGAGLQFVAYPSAFARLHSSAVADRIKHTEFDETLGDWIRTGQVKILPPDGDDRVRAVIPAGRYERLELNGEIAEELFVLGGETLRR